MLFDRLRDPALPAVPHPTAQDPGRAQVNRSHKLQTTSVAPTHSFLVYDALVREGGGTAMPWSLRREVLRTFGILGALDPFKFHVSMAALQL